MTARQKAFIEEYKKDKNQTQAAIRAGYSKKTAAQKGSYLRNKDPEVSKAINDWEAEMHLKNTAQVAEVEEFLTAVMRGGVPEKIPLFVGDGFQELKDNIPMIKERLRAAEMLGKRYGLFKDNIDISGENVVQIINDIPKGEDNGS